LKKERRNRHITAFGHFPVFVASTSAVQATLQTKFSSFGVAAINSHER